MWSRLLFAALAAAALLPASAVASEGKPGVVIQRSTFGIPHIEGKTVYDAGYGYGYVLAQDNICVVAETYVTVNGQRSRYFGPDASYANRGNGSTANNLLSDFFYQRIKDENVIEKLLELPPPRGAQEGFKEIVRGYVAGYNERLRRIGGADGVSDPGCKGKEWVRPITTADAYRRFYQLALLASQGVAIDGIAGATPPGGVDPGADARAMAKNADVVRALAPGEVDERLGGLGSNAYGLGAEATQSGRGIVLGNPHFPWEGPSASTRRTSRCRASSTSRARRSWASRVSSSATRRTSRGATRSRPRDASRSSSSSSRRASPRATSSTARSSSCAARR
jgi:acyl-homoserine-lactone acylase